MPFFEKSQNVTIHQAEMYDANGNLINNKNNDNRRAERFQQQTFNAREQIGNFGGMGDNHNNTMEHTEKQRPIGEGYSPNDIPGANLTAAPNKDNKNRGAEMYDAKGDIINNKGNDNRHAGRFQEQTFTAVEQKGNFGGMGDGHTNRMVYAEQQRSLDVVVNKNESNSDEDKTRASVVSAGASVTSIGIGERSASGSEIPQYSLEYYRKEIEKLKINIDEIKDMVENGYLDRTEAEEDLSKMKKEMIEHRSNGHRERQRGRAIGFNLDIEGMYHEGPVAIYLGKAPVGVRMWDGSGVSWYKIAEWGPASYDPLTFSSLGMSTFVTTIPKDTPSGEYLVRIEQAALHLTGSPEFFVSCAEVNIENGGHGNPAMVSIQDIFHRTMSR
ncbi:glycosyl hydrolase family 61-domain-containing protein [Cyathus striatus]|nr:glycosyl hydrolase family 61-domain-containing protein [Cyathus striatus]